MSDSGANKVSVLFQPRQAAERPDKRGERERGRAKSRERRDVAMIHRPGQEGEAGALQLLRVL